MTGSEQENPDAAKGPTPSTRSREPQGRLTRKRLIALVIAAVVIAAAVVSVTVLKPSPEKATIGVIIPQGEGLISHSEEVKSAVRMAMDELNAWGGIGNTQLEMVVAEIPEDTETLVETFDEMEMSHHPLVYVTISCTFLTAMAPLAEAVSAPLIGLSSFPGAVESYQFAYRYNIPPEVEVSSTMAIMEHLNVSSVGMLYTESPRGCTLHDAFEMEILATGGSVQAEACSVDQTDFDAEVENLTGNQAIFVASTCTSLALMFEAIFDNGYEGYVVASSCASSAFFWDLGSTNGIYISAPLLYKKENILARAFIEDFRQAYGIDVTHHGAVAYDIVHLVHGLLEGKEVTRSSLGYELSQEFIFTGIMGSLTIASGEHDFGFSVYPAMIVEGELLYL